MKFVNDSDVDSDKNESYSDEDSEIEEKTIATPKKTKRKYEDIPGDSTKVKKKHKNDLYKPPTVEELNNLRETEHLFNNNLFRLQIEELLAEIKIKTKRKNKLNNWLELFKNAINSLPTVQVLLSELPKLNKKINGKRLSDEFTKLGKIFKPDQDVTLTFEKPKNVQYFGLYENDCLPGPNLHLNINLTMPKDSFLVKDYLNNRYLVKRCFYLLYIADVLKQNDLIDNLNITFHENNQLLPIISLQPKDCDKTNIHIYVSPVIEAFKPTRFLPEQNNIKVDLFKSDIDVNVLKNTPTVYYNSLLGHDSTLYTNNEFIKNILKDQKNVQDGIKLLCVWLSQREFTIGLGAFTENILLSLVIYLLHKKRINKLMSSYQIIRNFWSFLSTTDLLEEGISIGPATIETIAKFKQYFSIVILDITGCYNVASLLNEEMYKKVKTESQIALKCLDDNKNNSFNELFLIKYPFHLQYDVLIDLSKSIPFENKFNVSDTEKSIYIGYENLLNFTYISKLLIKALNKRVYNVVPRIEMDGAIVERFVFGISLNPDEAFSFLEKGPSLNEIEKAAAYRNFWGQLATDRRFRDGSTNVAVYFKTNTIKAKRNIVKKVINFVLEEKLDMKFKIHYNEFEEVLTFQTLVPSYPSGTNEETCLKIILASDELAKKLRDLQMSLKITGVYGVSDVFAYADAFPPIPANFQADGKTTIEHGNNITFKADEKNPKLPRYVHPIECVLQLEHSSKWPNDLTALRHLKTSFYLEISKLLKSTPNLLTHPTKEYLEIFYEGIVFRYRLLIPKEIGLVKRIETDEGLTSFKESVESFNMEMHLNIIPKVVGSLKGLQSLYPSFGPGTALVKRWLRSHLIDEYHLPNMVVNLLNAYIYLNNLNIPNTPQVSFLRCLKFLSELDWNLHLILVNFNNELTTEEIAEVESKFQNNRNSFPNLFILTPYDQNSSIFTKNVPTKEILNRVKKLAKESLNVFNNTMLDRNSNDMSGLFLPNFDGYNLLIHIKPFRNTKKHQRILFWTSIDRIVVDKYEFNKDDKIPIVDFDPVREYLRILRENYGKYALFFHDSYGGNVIGVLWHPTVSETSDFKVSKINGGKIFNNKIVFNFDAAIEDFFVLGKDLVQNIERR